MFKKCQFNYVGDTKTAIALQPALKFNGGGHLNHSIFWTNLAPKGGGQPSGKVFILKLYLLSAACVHFMCKKMYLRSAYVQLWIGSIAATSCLLNTAFKHPLAWLGVNVVYDLYM